MYFEKKNFVFIETESLKIDIIIINSNNNLNAQLAVSLTAINERVRVHTAP